MCEFLGMSRAAYYEWVRKLEEDDPDQERMEQVQTAYEASHKTIWLSSDYDPSASTTRLF
jgi:predicted DNA-binding transcriptional regulator AlpA